MTSSRRPPPSRIDFPWLVPLETRWLDMDIYGHVNNVVYYSYFDTAIAHFLMGEAGLDPWRSPVVGFAVDSGCRFHTPLAFPDRIEAGLRVARLGSSSCRYEIGIFKAGREPAAADGHFVHVFVDRASQRPVPIPEPIRAALARLLQPSPGS
ncbi:MAG: acyl-CoA thioesterase [Geminicoccaceae bacterium]|nr:acyl-CoA thioesterase [Geminicoccaceae bacterium]MCX8099919.1 acyl-CoA thioesterase [Geminicoccaceae bacterium]MDW8370059.1 thioesterase family protein [Geminicoccaceae bacterium]